MADDQTKTSFRLDFTTEERQSYRNFLQQLYHEEGNIIFPLELFEEEVRFNYNQVRNHYSNLVETLQLDKDENFEIRLRAVQESLESLEVDGAVIFGVPFILFINKNVLSDDTLRNSLGGEKKERHCKEFYQTLSSIKHLVLELFNEVEQFDTLCLEYHHSSVMDVDDCLHRIMAPKPQSAFMCNGWRGRSHEGGKNSYHVFISHAGEDKQTMAIPLQERLTAQSVNSFLDIEELRPGDLAASSMQHAMQTAPVGVIILSPEFAAKRWPMRELECFLGRTRGRGSPAEVLPVFYRLRQEECGESELFRMENEEGLNLFQSLGFFDRVATGETSVKKVRKTLEGIAEMPGIENKEGAGNGSSKDMSRRRERLLGRVVDAVLHALAYL